MIVAGIDVGGTNTRGVILDRGKIKSKVMLNGNDEKVAKECMKRLLKKSSMQINDIEKIAVTGGRSRRLGKNVFGKNFIRVDEIISLGIGGIKLSGKKTIFVVSMGTGTAFVSVKNEVIEHLGGSGIGGGTITGLSKLMLDASAEETETMAEMGRRSNMDISVYDIMGTDLYRIPGDATASNFGKLKGKYEKKDIASSLLNMIAETLGVMTYFAAKSCRLKNDILLCGRVVLNEIIKDRVIETVEMFGGKATVPENAEYCAAIGAAVSLC